MTRLLLLTMTTALLTACGNNSSSTAETKGAADENKFASAEKPFGTYENQPVTEYTLTNPSGMQVGILNYGGTVTRILTPDRSGTMGDVVLGYESLEGFTQKNNPYFGSLVGRYANRIAKGQFTLDGQAYQLAKNDNGNSLHGGLKGYDKVLWTATKLPGDSALQLSYTSKDGEEGYPGNVSITVVYTLSSSNELKIDYTATTDKATPVNLTSHCYFNLSAGRDSTILNHRLQLAADSFTPVNAQLIPTGKIEPVKGGPMDFTEPKVIGRDIASVTGGFDHNWVLNRKGNGLEKIATLSDSTSGRRMDVYTTEPAIQFYSGNFLDGSLQHTKGGTRYGKHGALCLETQHYPDSPNQPRFPNAILKPGETYRHTTVYAFTNK